jgi:putative endonuclease
MKTFYVYILASDTGTLYTGITNNLKRRVMEHKEGAVPGFTKTYQVDKLLYYETFQTASSAIRREKQIKSYRREKKIMLIDTKNPAWVDLAQSVLQ